VVPDDAPYESKGELLPCTLGDALAALRDDGVLRAGLGAAFVDCFRHLKDAEIARFNRSPSGRSASASTSSKKPLSGGCRAEPPGGAGNALRYTPGGAAIPDPDGRKTRAVCRRYTAGEKR
jgi:hypothetical protein